MLLFLGSCTFYIVPSDSFTSEVPSSISTGEDYVVPLRASNDLTVCSSEEEYLDVLDCNLFAKNTSFSIYYSFAYSDINALLLKSSLWENQFQCTSFTTASVSLSEYVDSYAIAYLAYGYTDEGDKANAIETLGIPDDLFLKRGEKRSADFSDFPIQDRSVSVNVADSEQLWFATSRGYNPICAKGSSAEAIFAKAKAISRAYVSSYDSDVEKVRKIEAWIGNCITYDLTALQATVTNFWQDDCFYLEGIFNRHVAVCDGMSKAFVLLCGIENIPCVRVTGTVNNASEVERHAWNYVMLDGSWYGVCPTSNNAIVTVGQSKYEIADKDWFLVSKATLDEVYTQQSYPHIVANTDYGYFANTTFAWSKTTHNLLAENVSDLNFFVAVLNSYVSSLSKSIAFKVDFDYGTTLKDELQSAAKANNCSFYSVVTQSNQVILFITTT